MVALSRKMIKQRAKALAKSFGYLPYMIERYLSLWGDDETLEFLQACERPIKTSIRVNTLKTTVEDLKSRLGAKGVDLEEIPWLEDGFLADFKERFPGSLRAHLRGLYYVQGVPSMTAARVLDPQPGEIVMDMTAAPGGKTTYLAQMMNNSGVIVAIEQDRKRIVNLETNVMRCGVDNTLILRGDAKKAHEMGFSPQRVMLDAPCSGEGLIALDPTRKTSKTIADIRYCATREEELVEAAVNTLSPGGTMVYSTCSIAPEENEFVIDAILQRHHDIQIVPIPFDFGITAYWKPYDIELSESLSLARRFLPHIHGTEGFFICKMQKADDEVGGG